MWIRREKDMTGLKWLRVLESITDSPQSESGACPMPSPLECASGEGEAAKPTSLPSTSDLSPDLDPSHISAACKSDEVTWLATTTSLAGGRHAPAADAATRQLYTATNPGTLYQQAA
jgi:hypothetical protein